LRLSTHIPSTQQIRALEAAFIKSCGSNWGQVLMEVAGRGAAEIALELWHQHPGRVAVFCGRGNNGGDGMVVARYLHLWGAPVAVYLVGGKDQEPAMSTPESNTNKKIVESLGVEVHAVPDDMHQLLAGYSLLVDALLGTGIDRHVEGNYRTTIDAINRSGCPVLAVDLPSGINSDTGEVMGTAIRADHTVTFGFLKAGLLCHPGAGLAGQLSVIDIGLPDFDDEGPTLNLSTAEHIRSLLPSRPTNSNKGTFGTLLTIAGSLGMSGATMLAAESALRVGAGLSLLATPKSLITSLPPAEVIYRPLAETPQQSIAKAAIKDLEPEIEKARAVILGPGLSTNEDTVAFVQEILGKCLADEERPCVIDADALNAIAKDRKKFPDKAGHYILTPHPKELSRLTNKSVEEIQRDRVKAAQEAAENFGCVVILKGSRTIVADPSGETFINTTGNAGMATAGAGDVLSGIIGGLLAQGLFPFDAAVAGVYIHGTAGDIAAQEIGEAGLVAGDIARYIPIALHNIEEGSLSPFEMQLRDIEPLSE
jgi:NAD(P)H-hydrate epimerase